MTRAVRILLAAALVALVAVPDRLQAACRQALVLALDVSGSVDALEYRLQLDGVAAALDDAEVRAAILAQPDAPVDLAVFEWSEPTHLALLVGWTTLSDAAVLDAVSARLRATERRPAPPGTALGHAMRHGLALLDQRGACWKRTLDVSGDGQRNIGPHPRDVKPALAAAGVTVNALALGADNPDIGDTRQVEIAELSSYFRANVIVGPDAFVQTAVGYGDYAEAMRRKLLRELETFAFSRAAPDPTNPGSTEPTYRGGTGVTGRGAAGVTGKGAIGVTDRGAAEPTDPSALRNTGRYGSPGTTGQSVLPAPRAPGLHPPDRPAPSAADRHSPAPVPAALRPGDQ